MHAEESSELEGDESTDSELAGPLLSDGRASCPVSDRPFSAIKRRARNERRFLLSCAFAFISALATYQQNSQIVTPVCQKKLHTFDRYSLRNGSKWRWTVSRAVDGISLFHRPEFVLSSFIFNNLSSKSIPM